MTVQEILRQAAATFLERDQQYGSAYKRQGKVLRDLFPEGLILCTEEDFTKFALFSMIVGKANRWATAFKTGKEQMDSLHDLGVYAFMLQEIEILSKKGGENNAGL